MDKFIVIKDCQDGLDRQFQKLISEPESFTEEAFQHLAEVIFTERLTLRDKMALIEARSRKRNEDPLAHDALRAILHRKHDEFERLMSILDHRIELGRLVDESGGGALNDNSADKTGRESGTE